MKPLLIVTGMILTGIVLAPAPVGAQNTPVWPCDEKCQEAKRDGLIPHQGAVTAYSIVLLGQGLVVSKAGKRFAYRASWGDIKAKKTYRESELQKIEKSGVQVIRLREGADQDDVDFAMWHYGHTERDEQPGARSENGPNPNSPYR